MKFLAYYVFLFLIPVLATSQNETGVRSSSNKNSKEIFGNANEKSKIYHKQYPVIRDIPPVNSSMPSDIIISYLYLDSVSRHLNLGDFRNYIKSLSHIDKEMSTFLKHYYKVVDYNPIIFRQYASETQIDQLHRYNTPVNEIENNFSSKYRELTLDSVKYALYSMLRAEYILKVKITAIDSMRSPSTMYRGDTTIYHYFQAECIVQDTIKGRVFNSSSLARQSTSENTTMMTFSFDDNSYPQKYWGMSNEQATEPWYPEVDTNLTNYKSEFMPKIGQEIIVFLTHLTKLYDEHNDYYRLSADYYSSNNALPIINNIVYDVNKVWSENDSMTYDKWLERYHTLKSYVINYKD